MPANPFCRRSSWCATRSSSGHRMIPHRAASHGMMEEIAQQWGSGSSWPRKHRKTREQWDKWLGDCAGASGFRFPNSLWICSKMTTCDEEEERFPSEECALASRSHTAFHPVLYHPVHHMCSQICTFKRRVGDSLFPDISRQFGFLGFAYLREINWVWTFASQVILNS